MKKSSVYFNNLNRVRSDINKLIWYMEKDDIGNANIRADYIIEEVTLLVKLLNESWNERNFKMIGEKK